MAEIITNHKMNESLIDCLKMQDDNISKYAVTRINELEDVLKEAKEVLLQLDHRHNGKCYNPTETDCNCTLCKINSAIQKATEC
jgi:hypothetical protein